MARSSGPSIVDAGLMKINCTFLQSVSQSEQSQEVYDVAFNHVRASRLTDAELIYTPSQIALACLSLASPDLAAEWAKAKLLVGSPAYTMLQSAVEAIKPLVTLSSLPPDVENVRAVDRRLKLCKNPEKVVGSNVYLAKKAEEEKKTMEKMMRKAEKVKKAMEEGDPFGDVLREKVKPETLDDEDEEE
jgi:cyclin H